MATGTSRPGGFHVPKDLRDKADVDTRSGIRFLLSPSELCDLMECLDRALNPHPGISGEERGEVSWVRERLSGYFEDPTRRRQNP
jgi:hypothetical protein